MSRFVLVLFVATSIISCETEKSEEIPTDYNNLLFYDMDEDPMTIEEIMATWNKRLEEENTGTSINSIGTYEITDEETGKKTDVLIGICNDTKVTTAAILEKYKGGFKLNNRTTTCVGCTARKSLRLLDGHFACNGKDDEDCTKISTATVVN